MTLKTLTALVASTALVAPAAFADDMAGSMTLVSWGGTRYSITAFRAFPGPRLLTTISNSKAAPGTSLGGRLAI